MLAYCRVSHCRGKRSSVSAVPLKIGAMFLLRFEYRMQGWLEVQVHVPKIMVHT